MLIDVQKPFLYSRGPASEFVIEHEDSISFIVDVEQKVGGEEEKEKGAMENESQLAANITLSSPGVIVASHEAATHHSNLVSNFQPLDSRFPTYEVIRLGLYDSNIESNFDPPSWMAVTVS